MECCRRYAEAARETREAARDAQNAAELASPDAPGLFAFINASLGDQSAAAAVHRSAHGGDAGAGREGDGGAAASGRHFSSGAAGRAKAVPAAPDRQSLAMQQVLAYLRCCMHVASHRACIAPALVLHTISQCASSSL